MSCSVPECGGTVTARSLCNKHYLRLIRHGSPTAGGTERYSNDDERLWSQIVPTGFCWLWTGSQTQGYGYVQRAGQKERVHRVVWQLLMGPIPDGAELDHLCRVRACCNPDHLEPVTRQVNNARGQSPTGRNGRKVSCPQGHAYDIELRRRGGIERRCRTCEKAKRKARSERASVARHDRSRQKQAEAA